MSNYSTSNHDPSVVKRIAEAYGFCLVKGVFSPEEITSLERAAASAYAQFDGKVPDIYSTPLRSLLFDQRVRDLAHALLGDRLVYYRETAVNYEEVPGPLTAKPYADYHCDARGNAAHLYGDPANVGVYPAYRFAIYFRDYRNHSGGLKVAPGSHLRDIKFDRRLDQLQVVTQLPRVEYRIGPYEIDLPIQPIELYNVPSQPGDIVIFNLRCYHSAGAKRLMDQPTLSLLPRVDEQLPPEICLPIPPGSRNALFFDYGAPSELVDYYVKWRAVVDPATRDARYEYGMETPDWFVMRDDKVIVGLARRLVEGTSPRSAEQDADDLVALCNAHVDFGGAHPLFDRAAVQANIKRYGSVLAMDLARDIVARVHAHKDAEDRRRAERKMALRASKRLHQTPSGTDG